MKLKVRGVTFGIGFPAAALLTFMLSGELCKNYLFALLFASLHEIGHIAALYFFGCKPKRFVIGVSGVKLEKSVSGLSYYQERIVSLAGPFVNFVFAFLFFFFREKDANFHLMFLINAGLFFINMLPVKILDGGRYLYNLCLEKYGAEKAEKIISFADFFVLIILSAVMILSIARGYANTSFVMFTVALSFAAAADIAKPRALNQ